MHPSRLAVLAFLSVVFTSLPVVALGCDGKPAPDITGKTWLPCGSAAWRITGVG